MATRTLKGSKLWLGPAIAASVDTLNEFQALTYAAIGEVEDFGEVGDAAPIIKFTSVEKGRVSNSKGARDAGAQTFIVGHDPLDAGQAAMRAAEATDYEYAVKIELNDNPTSLYAKTTMYYRAIIATATIRMGTSDNVVREVFMVGVNSKPVISLAALI